MKKLIFTLLFLINSLCITKEPRLSDFTGQQLYEMGHQARIDGNYKKALSYLRVAEKKEPTNASILFELSLAHLACGNLMKGFYLVHNLTFDPTRFEKPWQGEPCTNKSFLIDATWGGFGDLFMFIRYAQQLKLRGAKKVVLYINHPIGELLSLCPYIDILITKNSAYESTSLPYNYMLSKSTNSYNPEDIAQCDYQCNLISLPHYLKTTMKTIYTKPYLYADPVLETYWKKQVEQNRFKIGVCWHGAERDDAQLQLRSLDLSYLVPLLNNSSYTFYCLQKGQKAALHKLPKECNLITFDHFDEHHGAFVDTAALMKNLDLVITIDTSIANLAGGLGIPVWVMVPFSADWRYHLNRTDSPWYPTMRIFRQPTPGNWDHVIQEIIEALEIIMNR